MKPQINTTNSLGTAQTRFDLVELVQFIKQEHDLIELCKTIRNSIVRNNIDSLFNPRRWNADYRSIRALIKRFVHMLKEKNRFTLPIEIQDALEMLDPKNGLPVRQEARSAFDLIYQDIITPAEQLATGKTIEIIGGTSPGSASKIAHTKNDVSGLLDTTPAVELAYASLAKHILDYQDFVRSIESKERIGAEITDAERTKFSKYNETLADLRDECAGALQKQNLSRKEALQWINNRLKR